MYQNDPNRPAVSQRYVGNEVDFVCDPTAGRGTRMLTGANLRSYIEELEARIRSLEGNAGHAQPNVSVMEAYNGDMVRSLSGTKCRF